MRPSRILLAILGIFAAAALLVLVVRLWTSLDDARALGQLWWSAGAMLIGAMLVDAVPRKHLVGLTVDRSMPGSLSIGVRIAVVLRITNLTGRKVHIELVDLYPAQVQVRGLPIMLTLDAGCHADTTYHVTPVARGDAQFGRAQVRVASPWRLWERCVMRGQPRKVKIYPNFASIKHFQDLRHDQQTAQMGVHLQQRRGEGMDFHQLREYRQGDALRQVDWKASSRHRRLISREYQDERDQEIIFLLDCGRRMRAKDDDLSHFDHALNALLLMAYVALRQGDGVGVMTFAPQQRWLAPVKGQAGIKLLLNGLYDIHSSTDTSDLKEAAQQLISRRRKRALVILISNIRADDRDDLLEATQLLCRHHLVMVASLRENILDHNLDTPVTNFDAALTYSGTVQFMEERRHLLESLRLRDLHVTDTLPQHLHIGLVNKYWELKRSGRI